MIYIDGILKALEPPNARISFDEWGPMMENISKAYGKSHYEGDLFQHDGKHFIKVPQIKSYFNLIEKNKEYISRICETGFHEWHSALIWAILFHGNIDIVSFDFGSNNRCEIGINIIKNIFPNVKLKVFRGNSRTTVPEFSKKKKKPPYTKCNLISVDGGHTGDVPKKDIDNMKNVADETHSLFVDNADSESMPGKAWKDSVRDQLICPLIKCQEVCDPPFQHCHLSFVLENIVDYETSPYFVMTVTLIICKQVLENRLENYI